MGPSMDGDETGRYFKGSLGKEAGSRDPIRSDCRQRKAQ